MRKSIMKKRIDKIMEGVQLQRGEENMEHEETINEKKSDQPGETKEIESCKKKALEEVDQYGEEIKETTLEKDDQYGENISSGSEGKETGLSPTILDFSSGSSDDFIPNSETDSTDTSTSTGKPKKRYTKKLIIPESSDDSDSTTSGPEPGCSHSNKKQRKSLKERRADRQSRLMLRNAGKSYVTKLGKMKPERNLGPLTDCRMKCNIRISHDIREFIFKEYWGLGSYNERAKYTERFIKINKKKTHTIEGKGKREYSNTYKIVYFDEDYKICKSCLLKTLGESNRFLQTVCEKIKKYGRVTKSERGRAASYKKISNERLKDVEQHINKFPAYESHYSRSKTAKKYLSSDLSLNTMYQLYCKENSNPVCKTMFDFWRLITYDLRLFKIQK
ncbi:hypothetical protein HW555_006480 [Spodoptera exigua]|uniref:Uncharacterized protein n=1 Tax=Spodoptera exigua TaxID=7107 RepID=A0A835GGI1_SPOEX|nr:hypothetical protein HW555_006480 [Spodoptera exigua]